MELIEKLLYKIGTMRISTLFNIFVVVFMVVFIIAFILLVYVLIEMYKDYKNRIDKK